MKKLPRNLVARIKRHKDAIAKHRDALRDIMDDVEAVVDSSSEGIQLLEAAVDSLSAYV